MALDTIDRALLDAADRANGAIEARARDALGLVWGGLNLDDYGAVQDALIGALPALVDVFGDAAAQYGVEWYSTLRAARGITSPCPVVYGRKASRDELTKSARFAAHSLYVSHDPKNARTLAEGALQKHVLDVQRRTIIATTAEDRAVNGVRSGWGIEAAPGCCDYCSRKDTGGKAMYHSRESARATFHDWCRCKAYPIAQPAPKPRPKPAPKPKPEPAPAPRPLDKLVDQHKDAAPSRDSTLEKMRKVEADMRAEAQARPGRYGPAGVKTRDGKPTEVETILARKRRADKSFLKSALRILPPLPKRPAWVRQDIHGADSTKFFKNLRLHKENQINWSIYGANPGWVAGDDDYQINCGLCTVTTELRMRGWDVIARPAVNRKGTAHEVSESMWRDYTGDGKHVMVTGDVITAERHITDNMPDGARGSITVAWTRGNYAHIFNWIKQDGAVKWIDGQNGETYTTSHLQAITRKDYTRIMRLDNLEIDDLQMVALPRKG